MTPPILAPLKCLAPVWLPTKGNRQDLLAFDPMQVTVSIRGIQPGLARPRMVPVVPGRDNLRYAFEGRLWKAVSRRCGTGAQRDDLATALEVLSQGTERGEWPLAPMWPEGHQDAAYAGDVPIPPRRLARATLAIHGVATEVAETFAANDLAHDGERIYAAVGLPLLYLRKGAAAFHDWQTSRLAWEPTFPHDRLDLAASHFAKGGRAAAHVDENRSSKEQIVPSLAEALHDVRPACDHVSHMLRSAPFLALETFRRFAIPESFPDPAATRRALLHLAALGAIGASVADPDAAVRLLSDTAGRLSLGGGTCRQDEILRHRVKGLHRYCTDIALPAIAAPPPPDEDVEAIGGLAP